MRCAALRSPRTIRCGIATQSCLVAIPGERPIEPKTIDIIVVELRGSYLVGTFHDDQGLAGPAELPGGKCEGDETPQQCAVRECLEETELRVKPVKLLEKLPFEYQHAVVDLHFWLCREIEPVAKTQDGIQ